MMDFDITAVNPFIMYDSTSQTYQHTSYAYDYSRIRLSPLWYPNTWNLSTWYKSDMNTNRRLYNYGNMSDFLAGVCSVSDLTNVIDTSNVAAKDLDDENIIVEDIGNLFG